MSRIEIHDEVQDIFREVFAVSDLVIMDETSPNDIKNWDSLAQIRLIMGMERRFGIKFEFEELAAIHNVGGMLNLLEKKLDDK